MKSFLLAVLACLPSLALAQTSAASGDETHVPLTFTGGYETNPVDHGRPVILIASALKVPPEVFRETFTHVKPAGAGQQPEEAQVRKNKQALLAGLSPYGVTDERLNEVSNYYRYNRSQVEMWRTTPASGYATVSNGVVTGITITNPGSGYSSAPTVSVTGLPDVALTATLAFGTDFSKNGSIKEVKVGALPAPAAP